jgi:hypothetical protein
LTAISVSNSRTRMVVPSPTSISMVCGIPDAAQKVQGTQAGCQEIVSTCG